MSDLEQLLVGLAAGISLVLILAGAGVSLSLFLKYNDEPVPTPRTVVKPEPRRSLDRAA
ncbi:hypothetical protein [Smaragdicoccus niigatensis]|uniref:hypothetical protein n=1 Tax=Smaragdicoccus niigatensis TaxID=359359 RepID=UPI00036594C1|nr:hypothetical protein [Smaragdicoccus niigatensis]